MIDLLLPRLQVVHIQRELVAIRELSAPTAIHFTFYMARLLPLPHCHIHEFLNQILHVICKIKKKCDKKKGG